MSEFCIKDGYVENPGPVYFLDDVTTTRGMIFQPDVLAFAEWIAEMSDITTIIDVGCGWGDKLAAVRERHLDWTFIGIDYGSNIEHCRATYSWGLWDERDLEDVFDLDARAAVIVCSDVIEHLVDPRALTGALRNSGAAAIIISTPERDLEHGLDHNGPSPNPCHVREWNGIELRAFLEAEGLNVRHVGLTRGNDCGSAMATTLVVCQP